MARFITCIVLVVVSICLIFVLEGGNLLVLFGFTPFLLTVLVPGLAALAVYPPKDLLRAFEEIAGKKKASAQSDEICRFFEKMFVVTGIIGALLGIILTLSHLKDVAKLGGPLAATLLCPLYAALFYLFTRAWRTYLKNGK